MHIHVHILNNTKTRLKCVRSWVWVLVVSNQRL